MKLQYRLGSQKTENKLKAKSMSKKYVYTTKSIWSYNSNYIQINMAIPITNKYGKLKV